MKHLLLSLFFCFVAPLLHASIPDFQSRKASATPYDPFLKPVRTVLTHLNGHSPTFKKASELLRQGKHLAYVYETPFEASTPATTTARRAGDCKAKSLWLASQLNDPNVRFVIGKAHRDSLVCHAWLLWNDNGKWWILDPTMASKPIAAASVGADDYLAFYSYDKSGSYCYAAANDYRNLVAGR